MRDTSFAVNFLNDLFGTIAGRDFPIQFQKDFIPVSSSGDILNIKNHQVSWLGLKSPIVQRASYDYCFPVASVVDKLAEFDLNGEVEILRSKGKGKEDYATNPWSKQMNKLLMHPNPLQTWDEFRGEQSVYKRIFGYCMVYAIKPVGFGDYELMINLPPWLCQIQYNNSDIYSLQNAIQSITLPLWGRQIVIDPKDTFMLVDSFVKSEISHFVLPQSKLVGLDMAISNLCAAMEADNVLLKKRGPLGFISHDAGATKDSIAGYLPMTDKQKKEIQDELTVYGLSLSQYQYVISRTAAKWNPMSYDIKQLGTKETVVASEKAVCHRWDLPYVLYEVTDATFSNANEAHPMVYQNCVIPNANKDNAKYNQFFKAAENDCKICRDFSELPVMQEDMKEKGDAMLAVDNSLEKRYLNKLITLNQWRQEVGVETTADGDVYYQQAAATPVETEVIADNV